MKLILTMLLIFFSIALQAGEYLGKLSSNKYDPDSVSNPYGTYGSKYSSKSINNPYGKYGSKYSNYSVNNPYATEAPIMVKDSYGNINIYSQD